MKPSEWTKMADKGWVEDIAIKRRAELRWYQYERQGMLG